MNRKDTKLVTTTVNAKIGKLGWAVTEIVTGGKHQKLYITNGTTTKFVTISSTPKGGFASVDGKMASNAWHEIMKDA